MASAWAAVWYKSAPYRSRIVLEPRAVLAEFGVVIAPDVEVRVWDSTAESDTLFCRCARPARTTGRRPRLLIS